MTFHQHSKEIVQEYLGTVAYVDDLIFSRRTDTIAEYLGNTETREVAAKGSAAKEEGNKQPERQLIPNIDPLTFTNAFLKKGIHCALLEVTNEHDPLDSIKRILNKSDVIILDWQMHADLGRNACELVESILSEDKDRSLSLRLLVIYTDQPVYNTLIRESIVPIFDRLGILYNVSETGIEIISGHTKIIVLQKPKLGIAEDGKISGENLPEKIIEEMTLLTEGLVSNTALKAVSVIRKNTHNLLGIFNKNLDSAYLAHRAMLPIPEDAELLVKETIVDSINSIISYSNINEACSLQKIEEWLDASSLELKEINLATGKAKPIKVNISKDELKFWQGRGYKDFFYSLAATQLGGKVLTEQEFNSFEKIKLKDKATECFSKDNVIINGANEEFAILTHHKSNLKTLSYVPYLTLGVVIQRDDKYFLCIQQRCDSIRIEHDEERKFLFLPLSEDGIFPIILKSEEGRYIKLKVSVSNCHQLQIKQFKQTHNGIVQATIVTNDFYFEDTEGTKYKWILDLKDSHAQRIANKFAAELSRVGLDESEWLRRN